MSTNIRLWDMSNSKYWMNVGESSTIFIHIFKNFFEILMHLGYATKEIKQIH
jgi:hypothetical protein